MEKDMLKNIMKNIIIINYFYLLKVNIKMEKEMEKEKNIINMVN